MRYNGTERKGTELVMVGQRQIFQSKKPRITEFLFKDIFSFTYKPCLHAGYLHKGIVFLAERCP